MFPDAEELDSDDEDDETEAGGGSLTPPGGGGSKPKPEGPALLTGLLRDFDASLFLVWSNIKKMSVNTETSSLSSVPSPHSTLMLCHCSHSDS